MNLGRHELLQWVNSVVQAEYPSIESLSDGVAYCQIFEAVHPGSINATRMALLTKLPLDCMKNLRLLENAMKNLKIPITVSLDKMGNGRFQDNILFTQWLYNHARKFNGEALLNYQAYERRLQILEKQNKAWDEVNMHLLPNEAYMSHEQEQEQEDFSNELVVWYAHCHRPEEHFQVIRELRTSSIAFPSRVHRHEYSSIVVYFDCTAKQLKCLLFIFYPPLNNLYLLGNCRQLLFKQPIKLIKTTPSSTFH